MPRLARLDAPGVLHHIIVRGIERRDIFSDDEDKVGFLDRLEKLVPETKTVCYAWALMSNHAHFLMRSGPGGISQLMQRLLTGHAVSFNRKYKRHGQLFQNRYKSIICQEPFLLLGGTGTGFFSNGSCPAVGINPACSQLRCQPGEENG
jgi:putative transposase